MDLDTSNIQLQYIGFSNTSLLWKKDSVFGLQQFDMPQQNISLFAGEIVNNLRLGKRVERFVSHQLGERPSTSVLIENIQVQRGTLTLGELDCILLYNNKPIHLEIIYKFYLYDENVGTTELEHWIGPNRKDSLIEKLKKLKDKQLPLLHASETKPILETLQLSIENITQQVLFKAQLFVPLSKMNNTFKLINNDCVKGFYLSYDELEQFSDSKFYIPSKVDWLTEVQTQTNWLTYAQFVVKIESLLDTKTAPLCWMKHPNGMLQKCFVIWWN